jgi:alpha-tubulin suppressor-like RCC1 family protein
VTTGIDTNVYDPTRVNQNGALKGVQVVQIDVYAEHVLALSDSGHVFSWGRNDRGTLFYCFLTV